MKRRKDRTTIHRNREDRNAPITQLLKTNQSQRSILPTIKKHNNRRTVRSGPPREQNTETARIEMHQSQLLVHEGRKVRSAFYILCYTGIMKMCHGSTFDFWGEYPFDDHWIGKYKTVKLRRLVDISRRGKWSLNSSNSQTISSRKLKIIEYLGTDAMNGLSDVRLMDKAKSRQKQRLQAMLSWIYNHRQK